jgi:hypothetical protein
MRFSTASVVRLERPFRHSLKSLLLTKIVRLNGPLGYVKKALTFVSPPAPINERRPSFELNRNLDRPISDAIKPALFY